MAIVVVTGIFTHYQNSKSEAIMSKFKNLIPPQAKVWRDGIKKSVEASLLVPGDIIEVDGGDKIPADIRVLEAKDMKVNNSSLTVTHSIIKSRENRNIFNVISIVRRKRYWRLRIWLSLELIAKKDMLRQ